MKSNHSSKADWFNTSNSTKFDYSPECYFKNPETGEQGWEIKFPLVYADSMEEAAEIIKAMPHFDCFVHHRWEKFNE